MPARPRRSIGSQRNPASEKAILNAAHAILAEEGPAGLTIEAVARRARAGKPTVYRWWPSRAHLLLAVFEREKEPFREPATGSLEGDLEAFLAALLACWRDTPAGNIFRSVIAEAQSSELAAHALAEYAVARRERNAKWLSKHVADDDAPVLADMLTAYALHRLASGRLSPEGDETSRSARFLARAARPSIKRNGRVRARSRRTS